MRRSSRNMCARAFVVICLVMAIGSAGAGEIQRMHVQAPPDLKVKPLAEVRAMLGDARPLYRCAAAQELARRDDRAAIPDLQPLLKDKVPFVQLESASALLELGDKSALTVVQGLFISDAPDVAGIKLRVVEVLAKAGDNRGLALAKSGIQSKYSTDRVLALRALNAFKDEDIAYAALQVALGDTSQLVRGAAVNMLSERPAKRSVALLSSLLAGEDPSTRLMALTALTKTRHPDAMPAFLDALGDSDQGVRIAAATSLNLMSGLKRPVMAMRDPDRAKEIEKEWREWWEANKDKPLPSEKKK